MESGGSSSLGLSKKGKKTERNRRAWTPVEEKVLIGLMKELVANGWKKENGFKPGYLLKLEAVMMKSLPGTDIRASPHITSRITIWKRFHGSLQTMLNNNSGIGFNAEIGLLDCHDTCWDLIVKVDPNATNMRYKALPFYDDWNEIFGMDRSNGRAAEDVADAANAIHSEDTPTKVCGKKRSAVESSPADRVCDVIDQFCRANDNRFDSLVHVIGYEYTLGSARKELPKVLAGIPELTEDERIDAAHMFAKNPECLEMFMGMADESRARYVHRLLNGHLKM
ncbi:hypothetical protein ACS0TY_028460 [Phlomoides rotata]